MNSAVVAVLLVLLASANSQLSYTDPSIYDGPCTNPVAKGLTNPGLFNPLSLMYVPVASKMLFRMEYTGITNANATTEEEVLSIKTRVKTAKVKGILNNLSLMTVSFFGNEDRYYNLQVTPTNLASLPTLSFNAKFMGGSPGTAPKGYGGDFLLSIIWSDESAWTIYGCIDGMQNFHIISKNPTLNQQQWDANVELLQGLGFNSNNFQNMTY